MLAAARWRHALPAQRPMNHKLSCEGRSAIFVALERCSRLNILKLRVTFLLYVGKPKVKRFDNGIACLGLKENRPCTVRDIVLQMKEGYYHDEFETDTWTKY